MLHGIGLGLPFRGKAGTSVPEFTFNTPSAALKFLFEADVGVLTDNAGQFTAANSEFLSLPDNPSISTGNIDSWFTGWYYADSFGANRFILAKDESGISKADYALYYNLGTDRLIYQVWDAATASLGMVSPLAAPVAGTWNFFMAYTDSVNDLIGISINGGAFVTFAMTGTKTPSDTNARFAIGANAWANTEFWNGRLQNIAFGKSPVGGIAAIRDAIRDSLYNAGAGKSYGGLTASEKVDWGLTSWWKLHENNGVRSDSHGTNHLTDNNTVTGAVGKVTESAGDLAAVSQWIDQSGQGNHAVQAVALRRPAIKLVQQNGKPAILFSNNGTGNWLQRTFGVALSPPNTVFMVVKMLNTAASTFFDGLTDVSWLVDAQASPGAWRAFAGSNITNGARDELCHILTVEQAAGGAGVFRIDGVPASGTVGTNALGGFTIGARSNPGATPLNGYVCALVGYNGALSAGEITGVETLLKTKWGTV